MQQGTTATQGTHRLLPCGQHVADMQLLLLQQAAASAAAMSQLYTYQSAAGRRLVPIKAIDRQVSSHRLMSHALQYAPHC